MTRTYNDILIERRMAYANNDTDAIARLNAELTQYRPAKQSRKPRAAGQAAYVAALKRNGWL